VKKMVIMKTNFSFLLQSPAMAGVDQSLCRMMNSKRVALPGRQWRKETAVFQEKENTHLWIVNRAVQLLENAGERGKWVHELVKPGNDFYDNVCWGLYDPDRKVPYTDSLLPFGLCPTWKSHFYDPDTQTNWLGQKTPTAVTRATTYYHLAHEAYRFNSRGLAGYLLGLALHFMGDLTQPMHAANFTWLSTWPCGYHTAFEKYVRTRLPHIQPPARFQPLALGVVPQGYLKAVARRTKDTYYHKVCRPEWLQSYRTEKVTNEVWHQRTGLLIEPILADAVLMTAQFLLFWAELLPIQESKPVLSESTEVMNKASCKQRSRSFFSLVQK
jgi:phospholipase C